MTKIGRQLRLKQVPELSAEDHCGGCWFNTASRVCPEDELEMCPCIFNHTIWTLQPVTEEPKV